MPGFVSGWPMGLFQAAFGISSSAREVVASEQKNAITASNNSEYFFIGPPKVTSRLPNQCPYRTALRWRREKLAVVTNSKSLERRRGVCNFQYDPVTRRSQRRRYSERPDTNQAKDRESLLHRSRAESSYDLCLYPADCSKHRPSPFFSGLPCLPVLVEADIVRRHVLQNRSPQIQDVYAARLRVEDFSVGVEQYCVWNFRPPHRIERLLQRSCILGRKKQVSTDSPFSLEHFQYAGFLIRHVDGNSDQFQFAILVHLVGIL